MARGDGGASERLPRLLDAAAAWASGLDDAALTLPAGSSTVGGHLDALARLSGAGPSECAGREVRAVSALLALADALPSSPPPIERASIAGAVRTSLAALAAAHPGRLVELRVPPWGAVQIGVPGVASVHRRGTPPNVVECAPATWLALADGRLSWSDALATARVSASGSHADLGDLLPLP